MVRKLQRRSLAPGNELAKAFLSAVLSSVKKTVGPFFVLKIFIVEHSYSLGDITFFW